MAYNCQGPNATISMLEHQDPGPAVVAICGSAVEAGLKVTGLLLLGFEIALSSSE